MPPMILAVPAARSRGPRFPQSVLSRIAACLWALQIAPQAQAEVLQPRPQVSARVQAAFTPGDDVAGMIVAAIGQARRQVLVQAYSFTHEGIAQALLAAHRRGLDVRLIADRGQTEQLQRSQVPGLARDGLPVWLDDAHLSAHDKVMLIDTGLPSALLISGSYNFTRAAQYKNAENVLFIRDSEALLQAYLDNWRRHQNHAEPLRVH